MASNFAAQFWEPNRWPVVKAVGIGLLFYGWLKLVYAPHLPCCDPTYSRETLVRATTVLCTGLGSGIVLSYLLHTCHLARTRPNERLAHGLMWLLYVAAVLTMLVAHLALPTGRIDNEPLFG